MNSKPGHSPGISRTEFEQLRKEVANLGAQLNEALSEKNQWNAVLRRWADGDHPVEFHLTTGKQLIGKILWVDRYTIGIKQFAGHTPTTVIIHKGAIATIESAH